MTAVEEALARQAERFAEVLELNSIGSWDWDVATGAVLWSSRTFEIMGLDSSTSTPSYELAVSHVHPEDRERYEEALKECLGATGKYSLRNRIVRADGTTRHVIAHGRLHRGSDDQPVRMVGTLQDVTEDHNDALRVRKFELDALSAQKRLEKQLRIMVDASPLALLMVDEEHRITVLNPKTEELFGYGKAELLGTHIDDLVPGFRDGQELHDKAPMADLRERRMGISRDVFGKRKDETLVPLEISLSPVETPGGRHVIATIIDRTEGKHTADRLKESETRFAQMAERIEDVFYVKEMPLGTISYVSPSCETVFGRSAKEMSSRPGAWLETIHPDDLQRVLAFLHLSLEGQAHDEEYRICRPNGEVRWLRDRAFPLADERGQILRIVGTSQDITEQRKLEAQLRQAQKMEAVGQLAAGVAHDFNNLLMAIQGCVGVAASHLAADSPAVPYLDEILRAVNGGAAISRQLLMFSRKREANPQTLNLNATVTSSQQMLLRLLGADIELTVKTCAADAHVYADEGKLEQVLLNLAINARDAMPRGGRLAIETETRSLSKSNPGDRMGLEAGDYVVLRVTDTGSGMSEETCARIFEPFFTTKALGEGTGLGMSTVFGIVQQAGGQISVRSEVDQGTTFEIFLPHGERPLTVHMPRSEPPQVVPLHEAKEEIAAQNTETILLVEDENTVRMTVRHYLMQAGFQVLEAPDGATALEFLRSHTGSIDLLVTDMVMPGMTGVEVTQHARKLRPGILALFISAHSEDLLVRQKRLQPGESSLQKPFDQITLVARIQELLHKRTVIHNGGTSPRSPEAREHSLTILVVEDQPIARKAICEALRNAGHQVLEAPDGAAAVQYGLDCEGAIDVLLVDAVLPDIMGVAVARDLRQFNPDIIVFLMSGYPQEIALPVELRSFVNQFVEKPIDLKELLRRIESARGRRKEP